MNIKSFVCLAGIASCVSLAQAQVFITSYDEAQFKSLIRTDFLSSGGLATPLLTSRGAITVNNGGPHGFTIDSSISGTTRLMSWSHGIGAPNPVNTTIVRPTNTNNTAFGCNLFVSNAANAAVGGTVSVMYGTLDFSTNSWSVSHSIDVNVPANGTWFSFLTDEQFNAVVIQAGSSTVEMIDNVVVGDRIGGADCDQYLGSDTLAMSSVVPLRVLSIDNRFTTADLFPVRNPAGTVTAGGRDLWSRVVCVTDGTLLIQSTTNSSPVPFSSVLAVYDATYAAPDGFARPLAYDHDSNTRGPVAVSEISLNAQAGHVYAVRVGSFGTATGTGLMTMQFTAVPTYCPSDFNKDGVVDFFDYLDFIAAFSTGC
jgi:hypothetical protein